MKKISVLIIVLLIFSFVALNVARAEEVPGMPSILQNDPNQIIVQAKNKTNSSSEYLRQEWNKLFTTNPALKVFYKAVNPIFKALTGYELEVTRTCLIALILSLILWVFMWRGVDLFWRSPLVSLAIAFLILVIQAAAGLMRKIVPKIELLLDNFWELCLFIGIGILIIALINIIHSIILKRRKEKAIENLPKVEGKIDESARKIDGVTKGMETAEKEFDKNSAEYGGHG